MKRLSAVIALLAALAVVGCVSTPSIPAYGSNDPAAVSVLKDGKAEKVVILSLNDFHGSVKEDGKNPGIAKLATVFADYKAKNPNTLVVSAGDAYQGSALSNLTDGKPVSEFFLQIGVIASAVGNHEFDFGTEKISGYAKDGGFPFLAANILEKSTGKSPVWAKPYHVVSVGGRTVAFIGLATAETTTKALKQYVDPFDFKDPAAAAAKYAELLKSGKAPEGKVDVVIALTHLPSVADKADKTVAKGMPELFELDAVSKVAGIDAIVTGHSHQTVAGKINGVPVVQGYYNGRTFGVLSMTFAEDGKVSVEPSVDEVFLRVKELKADETAKATFDKWNTELSPKLDEVIGVADGEIPHEKGKNVTPLGQLLGKMLVERFGAQVAIMNGGGYRVSLPSGNLTVGKLFDLLPFDNYAVVFETSGKALKEMIEHGIDLPDAGHGQFYGVNVVYDPAAAYKSKVVSMTLQDGTPVTDEGTYKVVTNDFQFGGGDKYTMMKPNAKNVNETFVFVRDVVIEAIRKAGTIKAPEVTVLKAK